MLTYGFHEIEDIVDGKFLSLLRAFDYVSGSLLIFSSCFFFVLADFFPGHSLAVPPAIEAARAARRADGEEIASNAPWTVEEQLLSIEARLRPAHRLMRRLQRAGAQAVAALWPGMPALGTTSRTADWLEVAAGLLDAWKGSSAQAGARRALEFVKAWYPGLDLDRLAAFRSEAQAELEAVEGAFIERAAAIAEYTDTIVFVPERAEGGEEVLPEWFGMNLEYGEDSTEVIDSSTEEEDEGEAPEDGAGGQPQLDRASSNEPRQEKATAAGGDQAETAQPTAPAPDATISSDPPIPDAAS